jgi:cytochrome c553
MDSVKKIIFVVIFLHASAFASFIRVCQDCHGKTFEKRAIGRSKIVKNLKKEEIIKRLNYFKTSNSIMKSYASGLSKKQISQIANVFGR